MSTCGIVEPSYDSDLVVYDGLDCNNLPNTILGCNDDGPGCPDFSSELVVPVVSGSSYLIRVGGWMEGSVGTGLVNITCGPAPLGACCTNNATVCSATTDQFDCANLGGVWTPGETCDPPIPFSCTNATVNDECIDAEAITCNGSDTFELSSMTSNVDDPTSICELNGGGPFAHYASVWYEFTSLGTTATISLCGPTDDSVMTLFTDTSDCVNFPANLVERDCNDDFCTAPAFGPPQISATGLTPLATYLILIDYYSGAGNGPFTLNITCP